MNSLWSCNVLQKVRFLCCWGSLKRRDCTTQGHIPVSIKNSAKKTRDEIWIFYALSVKQCWSCMETEKSSKCFKGLWGFWRVPLMIAKIWGDLKNKEPPIPHLSGIALVIPLNYWYRSKQLDIIVSNQTSQKRSICSMIKLQGNLIAVYLCVIPQNT